MFPTATEANLTPTPYLLELRTCGMICVTYRKGREHRWLSQRVTAEQGPVYQPPSQTDRQTDRRMLLPGSYFLCWLSSVPPWPQTLEQENCFSFLKSSDCPGLCADLGTENILVLSIYYFVVVWLAKLQLPQLKQATQQHLVNFCTD